MTATLDNGRTHEPSLRELTAEMDGLRNVMSAKFERVDTKMDERDRRYEDRFIAMDDKTSLALNASEKAVVKAETATEKRFDGVNEFRGTLSDQAANLLPRAEANAKFTALEEKFLSLKDELSRSVNTGLGAKSEKHEGRANISLFAALLFGAAGTLVGFVGMVVVLWRVMTGH